MSITSEFMSTSSMLYRGFHIMCVQLSSVDLGVIGSCVVIIYKCASFFFTYM